jgi:hypothetical protein
MSDIELKEANSAPEIHNCFQYTVILRYPHNEKHVLTVVTSVEVPNNLVALQAQLAIGKMENTCIGYDVDQKHVKLCMNPGLLSHSFTKVK